jgi:uncharacterized protein (TIGR02145 family)
MDSRGLCPTGWHVPSDNEWHQLVYFLDSFADTSFSSCGFCTQSNTAGGALKSASILVPGSWASPNGGATNSSGFTALPGGYRGSSGVYSDVAGRGWWYTSSNYLGTLAYGRSLYYFDATVSRGHGYPTYGTSVRCVQNTLPQINTTSISSVTPATVLVSGEMISEGDQNTIRGFCYGVASTPTISNDTTMNGTGLGVYSTTLQNLTPSTTYYVRAYATNSLGTIYGNEISFTTSPLTIGASYAGGIVFFIDSTGQHGLVCAPSDQGSYEFGCSGTYLPGTFSILLGSGQANTNLITNGCGQRPIAASVCEDLVMNGYNDWFLPSSDELTIIYTNLRTQGIGNFTNNWYWSSSQAHTYLALGVNFSGGNLMDYNKNHLSQVRAIRAF